METLHKKIDALRTVLPFRTERDLIENIVFNSSQIDFCGEGEYLFKSGDRPMGFYWILKGEAQLIIPNNAVIALEPGYMAGLDSFLSKERHPFDIVTSSAELNSLFINQACFEKFRAKPHFRKLINQQVLFYLNQYKTLLYSPSRLFVK